MGWGYHGRAAAGADQDCVEGMGTNAPSQTVKQQRTHSQSIRVQIDLLSLKTIDRTSAPSQTVKQQKTAFPLWLRRGTRSQASHVLTHLLASAQNPHLHHNGKAFLLLSLPEFRA